MTKRKKRTAGEIAESAFSASACEECPYLHTQPERFDEPSTVDCTLHRELDLERYCRHVEKARASAARRPASSARFIDTDGFPIRITVAAKPTLEELQQWVGGYVESHPGLDSDGRRVTIVCHDEGAIRDLRVNPTATMMRRRLGIPLPFSLIRGPVVILTGWRFS